MLVCDNMHPFRGKSLEHLQFSQIVRCNKCNDQKSYYIDKVGVQVQKGSQRFLDDLGACYRASWWHATRKEKWIEEVRHNKAMVHIGTQSSAKATHKTRLAVRTNKVYLYRVTILGGLRERVLVDDSMWPNYTYSNEYDFTPYASANKDISPLAGAGYRYINKWESPGAVSIIIDPNLLKVTKRQVLYRATEV